MKIRLVNTKSNFEMNDVWIHLPVNISELEEMIGLTEKDIIESSYKISEYELPW